MSSLPHTSTTDSQEADLGPTATTVTSTREGEGEGSQEPAIQVSRIRW